MGSELRFRKWVRRKVSGFKGSKVGLNNEKCVDRMRGGVKRGVQGIRSGLKMSEVGSKTRK